MDYDEKYPKSQQGGIWANPDANESNRQPPYRGFIVVTEEMLKTLVVLMRNNAFSQEGQNPDLGPRINVSAWLNTAKDGSKYFRVSSSVFYSRDHDHLFEENGIEQKAPPEPSPAAPETKEEPFPF